MHPKKILKTIYLAGFLFSFHVALTVYVNSSFLATKIPESLVGILYTASAIISIIGLFIIPKIITRVGSRPTLGTLLVLNTASIVGLIFSQNIILVAICFILFFGFNTLVYLGLDILIEQWTDDMHEGTIRGSYLTANNIGFMMAPLIAGYVIDRLGFGTLYGFALLLLFPVFVIIILKIPNLRKTDTAHVRIRDTISRFFKNRHMRSVFLINSILQFFYIWMIIYTPIYFHEYLGIAWDDIGIMFTVMLSAFVIFQYLVGKLADRFHWERPLMVLGLMIMGIATLFLTRAEGYTLVTLTGIMFLTRVGASIIEVMTESYFFKQVQSRDVGLIGIFRNTYPFASIIATLLGTLLLQFLPLWSFFIILGSIILCGITIIIPLFKKP